MTAADRRRLVTGAIFAATTAWSVPAGAQQQAGSWYEALARRPGSARARRFTLPAIERRTLSNGVSMLVVSRRTLPLVSVRLVLDRGMMLEPQGKEGLAALLPAMVGEGTRTATASELADLIDDLGHPITLQGFTTITRGLEPSLRLLAEMLSEARFPSDALEDQKKRLIADLERARGSAQATATRILNVLLYGASHPFARTASARSVGSITRDDLVRFAADHLVPERMTLIIVGDVAADSVFSVVERTFGRLRTPVAQRARRSPAVPAAPGPTRIYLFDVPGAPQSIIRIGQLGPSIDSPDQVGLDVLNTVFGAVSASRLNTNLRQTHSYTYGAYSRLQWRPAPEPSTWTSQAEVSTAKTDSALIEWMRELRGLGRARPTTPEELRFALTNRIAGLPGRLETLSDLAAMLADLVSNNVPLDYFERYVAVASALTTASVDSVARRYVDPDHQVIVIVGDRRRIEGPLRAARIAPITIVDGEGVPPSAPEKPAERPHIFCP
jgi:zinc protease